MFIVTGTNKEDLMYISSLLRGAGIVCGFEGVYNDETSDEPDWGSYMADATTQAGRYLDRREHPVVLISRGEDADEEAMKHAELHFRIEEFDAEKFCRLLRWVGIGALDRNGESIFSQVPKPELEQADDVGGEETATEEDAPESHEEAPEPDDLDSDPLVNEEDASEPVEPVSKPTKKAAKKSSRKKRR